MSDTQVNKESAGMLAEAAEGVWKAIAEKDLKSFGANIKKSFEAQIAMFPHMVNPYILEQIKFYETEALGWKISGAGGRGYLVLVSEHPIKNGIQLKIRR